MKQPIWQKHHIQYEPEKTVMITRSEHYYITRLQWFTSLSRGAKRAIRHIVRTKPVRKIRG